MKRILTAGLLALGGTAAVAAVTPVRELPATVADWNTTADRTAELDALARLGEAQREATDDVVARLADGRLSLAEATDALEANTDGRAAFRQQLAAARPEGSDRDRLAGFIVERAKERLGDDPGQVSALLSRVEGKSK